MPKKYDPLVHYLERLPKDLAETTLSFRELEKIIGAPLPDSAFDYRPWWGNQVDHSNRPQAAAWLTAGFKVKEVNQSRKGGWVMFSRSV